MNRSLLPLALALALALAGCATPLPIAQAPANSPPAYAVGEAADRYVDQDMLWGGTIVTTRNYDGYSEIEIAAYPLDRQQRPLLDAPEAGRFVALRAGFLDPAEFSPGRFVTVRGIVTGDRNLQLRGETLRVAELDARELVLWPRDYRFQRPQISVSVGVGVGRRW